MPSVLWFQEELRLSALASGLGIDNYMPWLKRGIVKTLSWISFVRDCEWRECINQNAVINSP